jgi:hypothetical protein
LIAVDKFHGAIVVCFSGNAHDPSTPASLAERYPFRNIPGSFAT